MPESLTAPRARQAEAFAALSGVARSRQRQVDDAGSPPPRFILEAAQSMAEHMAAPQERMASSRAQMAFWQQHMPSAIGATTWNFEAVREAMPVSYQAVMAALEPLEGRPQLVSTVFHMAAFPLVCTLIGAAWRQLHDGPLHLLMAARNLGWLRLGGNRWILDHGHVIGTSAAGLRQLTAGLKDGSIKRLLILPDGPHRPGPPGVRALHGVSETLGIKTALLSRLHAMGIPVVPFTHEWNDDALEITPRPMLDPAILDETQTIDAVVTYIEDLLGRRPEQWLNWNAARLRT
ncbi:MAG: hypothetical protein ABW063_12705 [Caulobacter sp.]